MRKTIFPIATLFIAGCKYERGSQNIVPLHADTRQPEALDVDRQMVAAIQVMRQVRQSSLSPESVARIVLDAVKHSWLNKRYVIQQVPRDENIALVRQVLSGPMRQRFVRNLDCIDSRPEGSVRVIKGQTVVEVPDADPRQVKWIRVDVVLTKADETDPRKASAVWRDDWKVQGEPNFECSIVNSSITPAIPDDNMGGILGIAEWLARSLEQGGKVLGVSISEISGIWDAEINDWKLRFPPAFIAS